MVDGKHEYTLRFCHVWLAFYHIPPSHGEQICLISSLFRDLARDPYLAIHFCAPALLMML
jgi:hypothetical protein